MAACFDRDCSTYLPSAQLRLMTRVAPLSACGRCKIPSPAVPFSACFLLAPVSSILTIRHVAGGPIVLSAPGARSPIGPRQLSVPAFPSHARHSIGSNRRSPVPGIDPCVRLKGAGGQSEALEVFWAYSAWFRSLTCVSKGLRPIEFHFEYDRDARVGPEAQRVVPMASTGGIQEQQCLPRRLAAQALSCRLQGACLPHLHRPPRRY